jgi:hypothetical protein
MKVASAVSFVLMAVVSSVQADQTGLVDLNQIDRSIAKEPAYQKEPHYALIVFGPEAAQRSWLVMDGDEVLYFDRNGNGDLTDPEDRIALEVEATKRIRMAEGSGYSGFNVFEIGTAFGVKLRFEFWVRKRGFVHADEWHRNILRERETNNWENGTLLRIAASGTQVHNPTLMAARPAEAQITHLDGPLTFGLNRGLRQKLQPWPQSTLFDVRIGTPMLPVDNYSHQLFAPLAESELPKDVHPQAVFTFPAKRPGAEPVVQTIELDKRCCGDTLYAQMKVPREAGDGVAKVSLSYLVGTDRVVHPAIFEVPIGGERNSLDQETSYVMFSDPDGSLGLNEALVALRVGGLNVQKIVNSEMTSLRIQKDNEPIFTVTLNQTAEVREVATALAENRPFAEALKQCNARFEVSRFSSTSDLRDKELSVIHKILQQETKGTIYTLWDRRLSNSE